MKYNFKKIESKWQKKWEQAKVFEAEIDKRKKFFITFPYPYVNLGPHIGHFFSLMRAEAFARYKRSRGFNVLFPQAWHATGSPIVGAANRVKEKEPKQIVALRKEGFSDKEIKKFEDPEHWIKVFGKQWHNDLNKMGISIDWRRNFITTSLNPYYDEFIRWQFRKLKEKNYVGKGEHPVVWDPKTNMPVGDHDRVEGEGEIPQEMILFKFKLDDGRKIITATLRNDTLMGITNLYIHPDIEYIETKINGEIWIVSEPMLKKLENQNFNVQERARVKGSEFVGRKVESFNGNKILILPAIFLDPKVGSGIVHSVPSDSADDLIALRDIQKDDNLIKKYNLDLREVKLIKPIEIFNTPGIEGNSAQFYLDKYCIKSQNEKEKLEKIRKELYTFTFSKSTFNKLYSKGFSKNLEGMSISKGQEIIKKDLLKKKSIEVFYELTGKVVSRSLTECIVKVVSDQWFIRYGDEKWKKDAHRALKKIKFYPESVRDQFEYVIDWLKDWACSREYGLGTKLPFDENWLIESLSDSTIYMAYYTIAHKIKTFKLSEINEKFFDYIFLGKGKGKKKWRVLKEEFEYWYPVDFRNSGKDLVQNHLTFFIFNHAAIFPEKYWPKGIGVNGWVKVEGQKMSKSIGNTIPLRVMADKFGADASRLTILNGGEGMDDPNWDSMFVKNLEKRFSSMLGLSKYYNKGINEKREIDRWIENKLALHTKKATEFMENTLFRSAIQKIYFELYSDINWYLKRVDKINKKTFNKILETFTILMQPFTPHLAEELWNKIGKKKIVSLEKWPELKVKEFEDTEEKVRKLGEDIRQIIKLLKKKPKKAYVYVLPQELKMYQDAESFYTRTLIPIIPFAVNDKKKYDPENKSKKVKPGRPGIYLE